ncbi:WD40-repeat-containing domain protein [Globomyces pollinis-pini]|nr:WD40-repeat-containing domain protein [Globomyces pollinis-pini]
MASSNNGFWNPWGTVSATEKMDELDNLFSSRRSMDSNHRQSIDSQPPTDIEHYVTDTPTEMDSYDVLENPNNLEIISQTNTDQMTDDRIGEYGSEIDSQTNVDLNDRIKTDEYIPPQEDSPTFFQGFRQLHPRLSISTMKQAVVKAIKKPNHPSVEQTLQTITRRSSISDVSSTSTTRSRMSRLPQKARHQALAISNIAKLFNDLLNERDALLAESDELENHRADAEDELRQVEEILTKFTVRKKELVNDLNRTVKREDRITVLLESLDERINAIGDQTVRVERKVRNIKGESAIMIVEEEEPEETNICLKTYFGHSDSVECVDFESPFGQMVSGSADKTIRVWDMSNHRCIGVLEGHTGWVRTIQQSGYSVLSGSGDHTVKFWDTSRLDTNGSNLVDLHDDDDTNEPLRKSYFGHTGGVTCLQFQDQTMVSGSVDKTIRQWDMETGATLAVLRSEVVADEFNSLDKILYGNLENSSSSSSFSNIYNGNEWDDPLNPPMSAPQPKVYNVGGHVGALHFWQHALAAGYGDGIIRLFDLRSGECHRSFKGHTGAVSSVTFDDNLIISGSMDKTIRLWDLRTGLTEQTIYVGGNVTDLSIDFTRIAIAASKKSLQIYQRSSGSIFELHGHTKSIRTTKMLSKRIVTGGMDSSIRIWKCDPLPIVV